MRRFTIPKRREGGFTLVEIAIVLVIIGLLLGGVLKGQELIEQTKIKKTVAIWDSHKAAFYGFMDKFRALPGDFTRASDEIDGVPTTHNGNGNGFILFGSPLTISATNESLLVWEHLAKAGFTNTYVDPEAPTLEGRVIPNGWGGYFTNVHSTTSTGIVLYMSNYYVGTGGMKVKHIKQIDIAFDDGKPGCGNVIEHSYGRTGSGLNCNSTWNPTVGGAQMEDSIANTTYKIM